MERTIKVLLDPILVHALRQNDGSALNVPRDDDLSGGDSQVRRDLLDLENGISEQSIGSSQIGPQRLVNQGSP